MMFVAFQSTKSNQHGLDIHKLPLHIAINGQNVCVKVYFIKWPERFLGDGKSNENHPGPIYNSLNGEIWNILYLAYNHGFLEQEDPKLFKK